MWGKGDYSVTEVYETIRERAIDEDFLNFTKVWNKFDSFKVAILVWRLLQNKISMKDFNQERNVE